MVYIGKVERGRVVVQGNCGIDFLNWGKKVSIQAAGVANNFFVNSVCDFVAVRFQKAHFTLTHRREVNFLLSWRRGRGRSGIA